MGKWENEGRDGFRGFHGVSWGSVEVCERKKENPLFSVGD